MKSLTFTEMERKVYDMEKKQNEMQIEIDQIAIPEVPKI